MENKWLLHYNSSSRLTATVRFDLLLINSKFFITFSTVKMLNNHVVRSQWVQLFFKNFKYRWFYNFIVTRVWKTNSWRRLEPVETCWKSDNKLVINENVALQLWWLTITHWRLLQLGSYQSFTATETYFPFYSLLWIDQILTSCIWQLQVEVIKQSIQSSIV